MIDVSVIIVNYNTLQMTLDCIDSIYKYTKDISYEVILVDNASTDGSREFFSKDKRIIYIYNDDNLGFGKANNKGIAIAKGRYILFLNSDTLLKSNSISQMTNFMSQKKISILGAKLIDTNGNMMHSYCPFLPSILWEIFNNFYPFALFIMLYYKLIIFFRGYVKVGYITGADLMISTQLLHIYGGFDEDFFMYFEETELQSRLKKYGISPYFYSRTSIVHLESKSFGIKESKLKMYYTSRKIFYNKTHSYFYYKFTNLLTILLLYIDWGISSLTNKSTKVNEIRYKLSLIK